MTLRAALIVLVMSGLLLGADDLNQKIRTSNTEHIDFPTGGVLTLKGSTGELFIEGWDNPGVEVVATRSSKMFYSPEQRDKIQRELNRITVKAERRGDSVVVTTTGNGYSALRALIPWSGGVEADIDYRIRMPKNGRIDVEHNSGEVHVSGITGNIHVTSRQGAVSVLLPDGKYQIDARTRVGAVDSDFPGHPGHTLFLLGQQFNEDAQSAQSIYVRLGVGDIAISKTRQ